MSFDFFSAKIDRAPLTEDAVQYSEIFRVSGEHLQTLID